MAPRGLKPFKKDKKPNDWVEGGIQGATLGLPLVTDLAPIPYLEEAVGTTVKILTTVQHVRENKVNFQRLADDVSRFISGIWKSYQEIPDDEKADWPPQELRNVIGELVITLESILEFVEEKVGRNKVVRVLYSIADAGKIQEYRERLATAMSQFEELNKMRSHLNINHVLNQVLKNQDATQARLVASSAQAHPEVIAKVGVNHIESTEPANEREGKERLLKAERQRLAEAEKTRKIEELHRLQQMEKDRMAEERTRELHRLREMEKARVADEQAKELQRRRDVEKARFGQQEQDEIRRLRELEKAHKDRQQFEQLEQVRTAAEEAMEGLRLKEEAIRTAEEAEKERKRLQKVEMDRMAAEERESECQRRDEEKAHAEAAEQLRRREAENIRISNEEKEFQRKREAKRDRLAAEKRRKAEAARLTEMEVKKHNKPRPKPTKISGKMKARVEEDNDDETVVDIPDSEELEQESEQESEDEAVLEAARLAEEEIRRAAVNKKRKKKTKANNPSTPPADNASANMNMGPTPTPNPASMPPMFHPSPFYPHHAYSPFGTPSPHGSPYHSSPPPLMGLYSGYYGQPSPYPPPYVPGVTVNNVNGGNINMSNFNNNNITNTRPRGKKIIVY